jgi:hypothetical protein
MCIGDEHLAFHPDLVDLAERHLDVQLRYPKMDMAPYGPAS